MNTAGVANKEKRPRFFSFFLFFFDKLCSIINNTCGKIYLDIVSIHVAYIKYTRYIYVIARDTHLPFYLSCIVKRNATE